MSNLLPEGLTVERLRGYWDLAVNQYAPALRRMSMLRGADGNRLWEAIGAKFPPDQILPYTNHVSYVRSNILAGLYTVGRQGTLIPGTPDEKNIAAELNATLDYIWTMSSIPYYQMQAGNNAALYNIGITHVSYDSTKTGVAGNGFVKGDIVLTNKSPMRFMRDPHASEWDKGRFCIDWDWVHEDVLDDDEDYAETWPSVKTKLASGLGSTVDIRMFTDKTNDRPTGSNYHRLVTIWVRFGGKVYEIHTIECENILKVRELKIAEFPFAVLYCNLPNEDLIGVSEPAKIFASSVAYNLNNSTVMTADAKNQRPPKFVSNQAQINLDAFRKHGNNADYTFVVAGEASRAVHYHQFPIPSPNAIAIGATLNNDIQRTTGVTDKYTGADTGSILTTGGMQSLVDQATAIDGPKIANYNAYSKRLTQLILSNLIEFEPRREYLLRDKRKGQYKSIEVNFPRLTDSIFNISMDVSAYLPRTKQRIADMANMLMEKQMQYSQGGGGIELITPEEWLMMQDLPMQEYMLERMGLQRSQDYIDKVAQVVFQYAALTEQGMDPTEALLAVAQSTQDQETGAQSQPITV